MVNAASGAIHGKGPIYQYYSSVLPKNIYTHRDTGIIK
jgi:hypothetical protein